MTKGLFHKCIFQSGAGYENGFCKNYTQEEFYDIGEKAFELSGAKSLDELRSVPADRLLKISDELIGYACSIDRGLGYNPSYVYYFKRRLPGDDSGAFHSSELWYMFGTLDRCWRPFTAEDKALSDKMVDYWCNFIRSGNPNGCGLDEWKPWTPECPSVMIF